MTLDSTQIIVLGFSITAAVLGGISVWIFHIQSQIEKRVTYQWLENVFKPEMVKKIDHIEDQLSSISKDMGRVSSYIKSEFGGDGVIGNTKTSMNSMRESLNKIETILIDNNLVYRVRLLEEYVKKEKENG